MKTPLKLKPILCSLLTLFLATATMRATDYYIDPINGDDATNDGSFAQPWKTFDNAFDGSHVTAGDTVYLRDGIYRPHTSGPSSRYYQHEVGSSTTTSGDPISGTAENMITVQAYGSERPILKGSIAVTGTWTQVSGTNIWKIVWVQPDDYNGGAGHPDHRFSNCQQVFVGGTDDTLVGSAATDGAALRQASWPYLAADSSLDPNFVGVGVSTNFFATQPIPAYRGSGYNSDNTIAGDGTLTYPGVMTEGSFFYDDHQGELYVWLQGGGNPNSAFIEASTATTIAFFYDYYHIKGLTFRHSNSVDTFAAFGVGNHSLVEDCDVEWTGTTGMQVGTSSTVVNCVSSNNGQMGAELFAPNTTYRNCLFAGNNNRNYNVTYACGGIKASIGGNYATIENCEFNGNFASGVWFDGCPVNDVVRYDGTTDVTSLGETSVAIIRNNYIHDNSSYPLNISGVTKHSAKGITMEQTKGALIANNIILRNRGFAIAVTDSSKCVIQDNIIASTFDDVVPDTDNGTAILVEATNRAGDGPAPYSWTLLCEDNEVFGNIIVDNGATAIEGNTSGLNPPSLAHNLMCDYNVYFRTGGGFSWAQVNGSTYSTLPTWSAATGYDTHGLYMDPGFAAQGGIDALVAQLGVVKASNADSSAAVAGVSLGCSTEAIQSIVSYGLTTSNASFLDTDKGSLDAANTWTATQKAGSGLNWEAGPSTGTPGTDLAGGFLYRSNSGQTYSRNWLLTGDVLNWGDFGLFVGTSNTENPRRARYYHDSIANATTIGHNTDSAPAGTDTLTVEGTLNATGAATVNGLTIGSGTTVIQGVISRTATLTVPVIAASARALCTESGSTSITVTGAAVGDTVILGLPASANASPYDRLVFTGYVSATNTVGVRANNTTGTSTGTALSSVAFQITILKF